VLPYFIPAVTTGLGFAWKSGIAAEVLGIPKNAIGTQLYNAKIYLETPDLFAWTIMVIVVEAWSLNGCFYIW
jgi:NitT/TauT family transport system permease protein